MLKKLEELFGFRTNENTNIGHYILRMEEMGKLDDSRQVKIMVALIERNMTLEERVDSLEQLSQIKTDENQKMNEKVDKWFAEANAKIGAMEKATNKVVSDATPPAKPFVGGTSETLKPEPKPPVKKPTKQPTKKK